MSELTKRHAVAVFNPGEKDFNTIALEGIDIIVPLEEDLDCDPLQDDEVQLSSLDGTFEKVLKASSPDAIPDHGASLINYNFRKVPSGYYRIAVRIGGSWVDVSLGLVVSPRGAWFLGSKLAKEPPKVKVQNRIEPPVTDLSEDTDEPELPEYFDQSEFQWLEEQ